MDGRINKIIGANMDIDFSNPSFGNSMCPWNIAENTMEKFEKVILFQT